MVDIVFFGGLTAEAFSRLQTVSANKFAPRGRFIPRPLDGETYSPNAAVTFHKEAEKFISSLPESEPVASMLLYVDFKDAASKAFADCFFPFSVARRVDPMELPSDDSKAQKKALEDYADYLVKEIKAVKRAANAVKGALSGKNLTPLLLPLKNFGSGTIVAGLRNIFSDLMLSDDPFLSVQKVETHLLRFFPKVAVPGTKAKGFASSSLYFKSPGSARHGYFRNDSVGHHEPTCLLNARSRLGSPYSFTFHFDCEPIKGSLAAKYPNCHNYPTSPKKTHVNIMPNDFVI